jgi:hypothetical protein
MVIGAVVIGQLVADMFKQVFIELMRKLSWRVHVVNYYLKICRDFMEMSPFGLDKNVPFWPVLPWQHGP